MSLIFAQRWTTIGSVVTSKGQRIRWRSSMTSMLSRVHNLQRLRGFSSNMQCFWEDPYQVMKRINNVIGEAPRKTRRSLLQSASSKCWSPEWRSSGSNANSYLNCRKVLFGVTMEHRDLFNVELDYTIAHCDLKISASKRSSEERRPVTESREGFYLWPDVQGVYFTYSQKS